MRYYEKVVTNQNTGGSVNVVDYSKNTAVMDFIRWLKKQPQWFGDDATQYFFYNNKIMTFTITTTL